jgi:hypothetical protein
MMPSSFLVRRANALSFRLKPSEHPFKVKFLGDEYNGALGTDGPFREMFTLLCQSVQPASREVSSNISKECAQLLLLPSSNADTNVGEQRHCGQLIPDSASCVDSFFNRGSRPIASRTRQMSSLDFVRLFAAVAASSIRSRQICSFNLINRLWDFVANCDNSASTNGAPEDIVHSLIATLSSIDQSLSNSLSQFFKADLSFEPLSLSKFLCLDLCDFDVPVAGEKRFSTRIGRVPMASIPWLPRCVRADIERCVFNPMGIPQSDCMIQLSDVKSLAPLFVESNRLELGLVSLERCIQQALRPENQHSSNVHCSQLRTVCLQYAAAVARARLHESTLHSVAFRSSFFSIIPAALMSVLTSSEVEAAVCGVPRLSAATLRDISRIVFSDKDASHLASAKPKDELCALNERILQLLNSDAQMVDEVDESDASSFKTKVDQLGILSFAVDCLPRGEEQDSEEKLREALVKVSQRIELALKFSACQVLFWRVIDSFDEDEGVLFLRFVWARDRLGAFSDACKFMVYFDATLSEQRLPTAETCFFKMSLPCYSSFEVMSQQIRRAINSRASINS